MTFVVAHITDSHLSDGKPFFLANFDRVARHIQAEKPDLVINTGDVSLNGADLREDLETARRLHEALGIETLIIPGNHDVGDDPLVARKQPADAERRRRWLDVFGTDRFLRDVPGWRLLGINSLILGTALPGAAEQDEAIADAVRGLDGRALALFLHKPLFVNDPGDAEVGGHTVNPQARGRLLQLLGTATPRLVCAGHLHEYRQAQCGAIRQVWAPATSFTIPDWFIAPHGGIHTVGFVRLALEEDGQFDVQYAMPEGMEVLNLEDFPQAYGDLKAVRAAIDSQKAVA